VHNDERENHSDMNRARSIRGKYVPAQERLSEIDVHDLPLRGWSAVNPDNQLYWMIEEIISQHPSASIVMASNYFSRKKKIILAWSANRERCPVPWWAKPLPIGKHELLAGSRHFGELFSINELLTNHYHLWIRTADDSHVALCKLKNNHGIVWAVEELKHRWDVFFDDLGIKLEDQDNTLFKAVTFAAMKILGLYKAPYDLQDEMIWQWEKVASGLFGYTVVASKARSLALLVDYQPPEDWESICSPLVDGDKSLIAKINIEVIHLLKKELIKAGLRQDVLDKVCLHLAQNNDSVNDVPVVNQEPNGMFGSGLILFAAGHHFGSLEQFWNSVQPHAPPGIAELVAIAGLAVLGMLALTGFLKKKPNIIGSAVPKITEPIVEDGTVFASEYIWPDDLKEQAQFILTLREKLLQGVSEKQLKREIELLKAGFKDIKAKEIPPELVGRTFSIAAEVIRRQAGYIISPAQVVEA
jgi:hypothetical protein